MPKQPTIQIVIDAKGMPLTEQLMRHAESCVMAVFGAQAGVSGRTYWIMRTDIYHQFLSDSFAQKMLPPRIGEERCHEPSADLYLPDFNNGYPTNVPFARIVNLKIPEAV